MQSKPAGAACLKCPARDAPIVLPQLPSGKVRLSVVGESPFRTDFDAGVPFASRGGQLLERGLRTIGVARDQVHWTNAVLCECKKDDLVVAARQCRRRLHEELNAAGARVVIPTGSLALKSVLRPKSARIQDWRGSISALHWQRDKANQLQAFDITQEAAKGELEAGAAYVTPIMHPVFVQRAPEWAPILEIDVARIGRILHDGWTAPEHMPGRVSITCKDSLDALDALTEPEIAADVETPMSINAMSASLLCFVLADRKTSIVVPWARDMLAKTPWWQDNAAIAKKITTFMKDKVVIGHNLSFDIPVFARHGITFGDFDDTLLGQHVLASNFPKSLRHVTSLYLDCPQWKLYDNRGSLDLLHDYNHRDGVYSILAWHAQKEELYAA